MSARWPWIALALLGAYHGINPAMGWLFALSLGLQEGRRTALLIALLPIALGHAAAIALALLALNFVEPLLPANALKWTVAAIVFAFGLYRLFRARHPRGAGMRVGGRDLFLWSFLMSSAHGAGLMLIPVLWSSPMAGMHHGMADSIFENGLHLSMRFTLLSILVHTAAMLIVAGALALFFFELYDQIGLKILRYAWFNFDLIWAFALLIAAIAVLLS
jgi:hypothetical protein